MLIDYEKRRIELLEKLHRINTETENAHRDLLIARTQEEARIDRGLIPDAQRVLDAYERYDIVCEERYRIGCTLFGKRFADQMNDYFCIDELELPGDKPVEIIPFEAKSSGSE